MKRWISLFVENEPGVLARISGLLSAKSYNVDSLTVGTTEDETISRMTISLTSDDRTFEQVKKQLNRSVEVIKVLDFTEQKIYTKELLLIKIFDKIEDTLKLFNKYNLKIIKSQKYLLIESLNSEDINDDIIKDIKKITSNIEVIRGGSVAISL